MLSKADLAALVASLPHSSHLPLPARLDAIGYLDLQLDLGLPLASSTPGEDVEGEGMDLGADAAGAEDDFVKV